MKGLGSIFTRAATGERLTITPVIDGVDQTPLPSTFIWANALSGTTWPGVLGDSWCSGMSIPAAWRAATLIADLISALPYDAFRRIGDRPLERLQPTPPVLDQPHPPETRFNTLHAWVLDLIWNGNGVGLVASRDSSGQPTALSPVCTDQIQVGRDPDSGRITYKYGSEYYDYTDVFHVKGPHKPGELRGKGVLELFFETLKLARDQRTQAGSISAHGVPSGIIESADPKMDDTRATALKQKWQDAQVTRVPMVLNPQTKFTAISWNPEQLQLNEARRLTTEEMALIFGIPAYYLNAVRDSKTYQNVQDENLQLLRFSSVAGHLARFEGALSALLPRGTIVRADLDETLLRPDIKTRFGIYQVADTLGIYTRPEMREREGLAPLPDTGPDTGPDPEIVDG